MKKILILISALAVFSSCDWFMFDNQEQFNAQVEGRFIDSATGENVLFGSNPATFNIVQEGYIAPGKKENVGEATQSWYVKFNGEYRNKLVWAGNYRLNSLQSNYYPENSVKFTLNKGANKQDFTVTPYARVINPKFSYNAAEKMVTVTFAVNLGKPADINSVQVALFGFSDRFVCDAMNRLNDDSAKATIDPEMCDGKTEITLSCSVEPNSNNGLFKYDFDKFFRVGVLAKGAGVNNNSRYNFGQTVKAAKGFASFEVIGNDQWSE